MDEDYYNFIIEHSHFIDGLHLANIEALICLKTIAYLDIQKRIENGSKEDAKQLKKHKGDVFRLMVMLTPDSKFYLPNKIQDHLNHFSKLVGNDLPDKSIFKEMGLSNIDSKLVYEQFKKSFGISSYE